MLAGLSWPFCDADKPTVGMLRIGWFAALLIVAAMLFQFATVLDAAGQGLELLQPGNDVGSGHTASE
jgi:hypothetical protein